MIKLKDILNESINEGVGREAMGIAGFTGTRGIAVQKFIDDFNLNAKKLFNFISKGKLKDRMDFATAISGKSGNKYQGNFVGMFGESVVSEGLYHVGYNKGRGQGTGVFKDSYSSYKDAKKAVEKLEKERGGSYNMVAYYVSDKDGKLVKESVNEVKSDYPVYHYTYTSAIQSARDYAEKKGYEIDDEDAFRKIGMGPRKPSDGKTNRFSIELTKNGKPQKKMLHIQVYGMGTYKRAQDGSKTRSLYGGQNEYELNCYIN